MSPEADVALAFVKYASRVAECLTVALAGNHEVTTCNLAHLKAMALLESLNPDDSTNPVGIPPTELLRLTLPCLVARTPEAVLEVRHQLRDHLDPFRLEMRRLLSQISPDLPASRINREVRQLVQTEIEPKIRELRKYLARPDKVLMSQLIPRSAEILTTTVALVGFRTEITGPAAVLTAMLRVLVASLMATHEYEQRRKSDPYTFAVVATEAHV